MQTRNDTIESKALRHSFMIAHHSPSSLSLNHVMKAVAHWPHCDSEGIPPWVRRIVQLNSILIFIHNINANIMSKYIFGTTHPPLPYLQMTIPLGVFGLLC